MAAKMDVMVRSCMIFRVSPVGCGAGQSYATALDSGQLAPLFGKVARYAMVRTQFAPFGHAR